MAKTLVDPLSLVIGVGLGIIAYGAVVYGWPLVSPYVPAFDVDVPTY